MITNIIYVLPILIICSVLIFPIFIRIYAIYTYDYNKIIFSINVLGIRILSGYICPDIKNLTIFLPRKSIDIKHIKLLNIRKNKLDSLLLKIKSYIEIGNENLPYAVGIALLINTIEKQISSIVKVRNSNYIDVYDFNKLNLYLDIILTINIVTGIIFFIKKLMENINAKRKQIRQNN